MTTKKTHAGDEDQPKRPKQTKASASQPESGAKKSAAKKPANSEPTAAAEPKASAKKPAAKAAAVHEVHETERPSRDHAHRPASHDGVRSSERTSRKARPQGLTPQKMVVVAALVLTAFISSYNFAAAKSVARAAGTNAGGGLIGGATAAAAGGGCGMSGGAGGGGGGCCGGGGGAPVEGQTAVQGTVQKIAVDTSTGSFNPNVIKAKAGVPIEIAFSQSPGGCLSGVLFPDFGIQEDLTAGPKTVKLPALEKGEYTFYCQMQMVSAKIVVE